MAMTQLFQARWDGHSKFMFGMEILALGVFGLMAVRSISGSGDILYVLLGPVLFGLSVNQLLHSVWGYRIEGNQLLVRRLWWTSRVDLSDVEATSLEPSLVKKSRFAFSLRHALRWVGPMRHPKYGRYQSYCVNRANVVVMAKKSSVVAVSPEDPDEFVKAVGRLKMTSDR